MRLSYHHRTHGVSRDPGAVLAGGMAPGDLHELVHGVKLLCLDAGNTVIFLDHARLARLLQAQGHSVTPEVLVRTEGEAKLRQEQGTLLDVAWKGRELPGAAGWGKTVGTMVHLGGVPEAAVARLLSALWAEHVRLNLWSLVPEGFGEAIDAARARGVKVAVVSNSEGMLDVLFEQLGVSRHLDLLLDSGKVGIEKPDPRIFQMALDAFGVQPRDALHLGDSIATDVLGARAAGIRVALVDPYGHCEGRALDVPRVAGVAAVAEALALTIG
jgi:HAD superfamily hydrolase (TIGR01509 family)